MPYIWNAERQKFIDSETGRSVPRSAVRKTVDDFAASLLLIFLLRARGVLEAIARIESEENGEQIFQDALSSWFIEIRSQIKSANLAAASIAFGGLRNISASELEIAEQFGRDQISWFANFAAGVFGGSVNLNGNFAARTGMYASAVFSSYENANRIRESRSDKNNEERRILGASDHCTTCLSEAAKGWVALGSLKPIGNSECKSRCRCHFQFRNNPSGGNVSVT